MSRAAGALDFLRDVRHAARSLLRARGYTAAAIASLALGLALTATTLAVVNAYLIRSLPYPAADRLYHVVYAPLGGPEPEGMSALDWEALADIVEAADASAPTRLLLGEGPSLKEAIGLAVARGSVGLLDVRSAHGRSLVDADFQPGAERVVLIGQALWRDRFGGDPDVVGSMLRARRADQADPAGTYRIVGVLPPDFHYAREHARGPTSFVVPLLEPMRSYMVRLRAGVPADLAESRITAAARSSATSLPPDWNGVELESVHDRYVAGLRPVLLAVTLAGAIVLLIVTLNVAVLTLLRALRRQREIAVRVALGASRRVVLRLLAMEAALIAAGALGAGLAVTQLALRLLAPVIEERLGRAAPGGTAAIALDTTVLFAVAGATVAIALSMTFLPLLTPWRRQLAATLRSAGRTGTAGPAFRRMRDALIALEVGASLALLVGCGLMLRTVVNLVGTDLGIRTDGIERVRIALPASSYPDPVSLLPFYERLASPLHGHAFAVTNFIPFYEVPTQRVEYEAGGGVAALDASVHAVSDGYFELFGIRTSRGRGLLPADRAGAEPVAVVSETLARRLGPPGSAVGRRIRTPAERASGSVAGEWRTVVGVVGDTRQTHTDVDQRDVYVPFLQAPARYASLYFRVDGQRALSVAALREAVARVDPAVLVSGDVTGSNRLAAEESRQLAGPTFLLSVLSAFAIFALLLAVLGMYGVTAYTVRQREREVAIRIAVGASVRAVVSMFLKEAGLVLLVGVAAGLLGAAAVARLLASQLHGVEPLDPATLVAACGFIVGAALLAAWWPATRAAAGDPRILNAD